jgi:hypothetical protein
MFCINPLDFDGTMRDMGEKIIIFFANVMSYLTKVRSTNKFNTSFVAFKNGRVEVMVPPTISLEIVENSSMRACIGMMAWDMAMYLASVVERAISDWSLEDQRIGQEAKVMTWPVLDLTEVGSWEVEGGQIRKKSASR